MDRPISVLHVEDDGDFADLAARHFERLSEDIAIDRVEGAEGALSSLDTGDVDCVLSDYDMPGLDGLELLETVRADYPDLPYILFTSEGSREMAARALDAGATDYVPKEPDEAVFRLLVNRIRNAVGPRGGTDGNGRGSDADVAARIPVGVVEIDETETIRDANEAARDALVAGNADLVGRRLPDVVEVGHLGEGFLAGYRDAVETLSAGEVEAARSEFAVARNGDERFYEATYVPRSAADGGVVATVYDVTEHRRRETELERYESLLEVIPDTVVVSDVDGNYLAVHGFEGWSGYTREELLDMTIADLIPAEYRETAREAAWELWEDDEREKVTVEIEVETKDGERIPLENHLRFLPSDDGQAPHVMSVLRDISDRKARERQLNALTETMRELVTADSPAAMAELVVETARDVLGFDIAAVALYDEDADRLEPAAASEGAADLLGGESHSDDGLAREAYEAGEVRRTDEGQRDEGSDDADGPGDDGPVRSEVVYPLGEYGVLHLGSSTDDVEDRTVSLAEMLAGNVEAALDRVFYREELELLAERERDLERYERAMEATSDGIAIMSDEAEFLMVNSWFAESVGQTKEELEGTAVDAEESDVIIEAPDDLAERWLEAGEEALEEGRGTFLYESVVDLPHGLVTIENRVTAVQEDDGTVIYVVSCRNITERKEREEQIEELHASTRNLMMADSEEHVAREVVDAVQSTLGFPANVVRLVDDAGDRLEPVAVTDQARELLGDRPSIPIEGNALGEAFQSGEALLVDDVREQTDAFEDSDVRSVLSLPIGDYGLLSIVDDEVDAYDESDVRIAEILTANAEAAFERVEREEALRERGRALARQNERLDQFASIVSHDLRNPLNVAMGHLTFVEEQVEDTTYLEAIDGALERMQAIIDDVLTLAREGDEAAELSPVDLRTITEACWGTVDTEDASLEATTDRTIVADDSRLQQLLENLIRNGMDHVGDDVTIRVGDLDDGFYVEDDGPGIPPAEREEVFEIGFSTSPGGTGFGLNIVKMIAEAHDWDVTITDGSDGGARFEFTGVDVATG